MSLFSELALFNEDLDMSQGCTINALYGCKCLTNGY